MRPSAVRSTAVAVGRPPRLLRSYAMTTPVPAGFRAPAEWAPHRACWLAWPSDASLWQDNLPLAQQSFTELCRTIADGEALEVLVPDSANETQARAALQGLSVRFHRIPFGDIWLRDTAPIFLTGPSGKPASVRFAFNGWGGKYVLDHDEAVAKAIADAARLPAFDYQFVLEGGSIEVDGEGTVLTTRQCLLNPNRNPGATESEVEAWLCESLGAQRVLWLDEGLLNDHTDGHIDTIARFVRPGVVVCMKASGADDPNARVLGDIARALRSMKDARGRALEVVEVPSPGRVCDFENRVMPASYVNYYLANRAVAVPTYGSPADGAAVDALARLFPGRKTTGIFAKAILSGGGAFHCITQQEPSETA